MIGKISSVIFLLFVVLASTISSATDLDLREANVMEVLIDKIEVSRYNFAVTLFHDDDGEEGYADYWQVETLNGTILGKRILTHAHGTNEFTRSEIITIPNNITVVVVRGHDSIHDFGGQAIIIDIETSSKQLIDQGSEKQDFSDFTPWLTLGYISPISNNTSITSTSSTASVFLGTIIISIASLASIKGMNRSGK